MKRRRKALNGIALQPRSHASELTSTIHYTAANEAFRERHRKAGSTAETASVASAESVGSAASVGWGAR
jgi:hypothetical protein